MGKRWAAAFAALLAAASPAAAEELSEVRAIASGGYLAPQISPRGDEIVVTGDKYSGLALLPVAGGPARALVGDAGAGVNARFLDADRILFDAVRAGARRQIVVSRDGAARAATAAEIGDPVAIARDDRVYVAEPGGGLRSIASGDRFFAAAPSPDGTWVAFQGLATGIHLYERASGRLVHLGPGTAPAWSPGSDRLVFERTEDDGHDILGSELHLYDLGARRLTAITSTADRIERRPSFGPDGRTIAFDDDRGTIYLGRLPGAE
jgi:hypothetical protein